MKAVLASLLVSSVLCATVPASAQSTNAQDVAAFYKGKQLRMIVGSGRRRL